MRSFLTYGLISLVGVASLYACGDDSGDGPGPGVGGSAGQGGSGGQGGSTAGTAGMAGSGGGGAAGSSGGGAGGNNNQTAANCTGCVELDIPFAAASQAATYQFVYPPPGLDFSNANITFAVQLLEGGNPNLFVKIQVQNGAPNYPGYYTAPETPLTAANFPPGQFVDVSLNMATIPGLGGVDAGVSDAGAAPEVDAGDAGPPPPLTVFDKTRVEGLQLQIGSTAAFTGTQFTTVEVDSVTITGVTGTTGATFTNGVEGFALNNYTGSPTPVGTAPVVAH